MDPNVQAIPPAPADPPPASIPSATPVTAAGDLPGHVRIESIDVLAEQKMMTIFSMLFGAGIVLMASKREQAGAVSMGSESSASMPSSRRRSPAAAHYRRMLALLVIGMVHAYALWYGDILVTYAMCGARPTR